ncbi:MAG: hypothetical protein IPK83_05225 [Planctomycetes bacterium]|nr:hypothetical protein [Planctomycetota bacterium]
MTDSRESKIPQSLVLKPPRQQIAIILLATCVAALLAGRPSLNCGFTSGDDQRFITDHSLVAHPSLDNALKLLTIVHGDLYQPLPMLTFQANFALAESQPKDRFGISAFVFHLTNVVLHALNALFVTLIALRMSRRASIALITGLLFACHPFAAETVAWVSGRMMLLSTTFALVTIWLCLSSRPHKRFAAGVTWLLSLASKVQPAVPIAAAWIDYKQHGKFDRRTTLTHCFLLLMALAASAFAIFTSRQAGFVGDDTEFKSSPAVRILLASRYYLENYVVPAGLSPWVPPPDGVALASAECLIGLVEWIGLLFIAVLCRKRFPIATLGIAAFAILLLPFLAAPAARRFLAADRYMYLPIFGLHLAVASLLVAFSDAVDRLLNPSFIHRFLILPTAAILLPCLLLSWTDSLAWTDTITREERAAFVYPDNPLTHYELASLQLHRAAA